jgi:hypothetical protein
MTHSKSIAASTIMQGLQTDARAGVKPEVLQATARFSLAALTRR